MVNDSWNNTLTRGARDWWWAEKNIAELRLEVEGVVRWAGCQYTDTKTISNVIETTTRTTTPANAELGLRTQV